MVVTHTLSGQELCFCSKETMKNPNMRMNQCISLFSNLFIYNVGECTNKREEYTIKERK